MSLSGKGRTHPRENRKTTSAHRLANMGRLTDWDSEGLPADSSINKGLKTNTINTEYKDKEYAEINKRSWKSKHSIRTTMYYKYI